MKTVGYVISHKNGENRRALFPAQCTQLKFPEQAIFETGYGLSLGFSDADYERAGVKLAAREEVLRADVIVDVKLGDAEYLDALVPGKILCGWAHTVQKTDFAGKAIRAGHTVIALEHLRENGRYLFRVSACSAISVSLSSQKMRFLPPLLSYAAAYSAMSSIHSDRV